MFKRFTQVRDSKVSKWYGQVVDIDHTNVVNGVDVGNPKPYYVQWMDGSSGWDDGKYLRRETFLEFILKRPGYVGKTPLPFVLYCFLVWLGLLFSVPAFGAVFIALFFGFQYANFKGWTR